MTAVLTMRVFCLPKYCHGGADTGGACYGGALNKSGLVKERDCHKLVGVPHHMEQQRRCQGAAAQIEGVAGTAEQKDGQGIGEGEVQGGEEGGADDDGCGREDDLGNRGQEEAAPVHLFPQRSNAAGRKRVLDDGGEVPVRRCVLQGKGDAGA